GLADPPDVVRIVAEHDLLGSRPPRLLVFGEGLEEHSDPLGPFHVVAGRVQAREVRMADQGARHDALRSVSRFERPARPHFFVSLAARSHFGVASGSFGSGASCWRVAMRRYSRSWSAIVGKPPASSAASSEPCFFTIAAARPGPTPGAPGIRSDGSPRRAMKSGTCAGSTPYRSRTSAGPTRWSSETPRFGCRIVVRGEASWNRSRSFVRPRAF